jgi:hypothetical protein
MAASRSRKFDLVPRRDHVIDAALGKLLETKV